MQALTIERAIPFLLANEPVVLALVGCGGTGSHLAQSLARLAAHCREIGAPELHLCFVDGDVVEPKNVGRQLFAPAEIGRNKAQTLAARFNAAFGLTIDAIPAMATVALLNDLVRLMSHRATGILLGAVDGPAGRRALHEALALLPAWKLWIDCGNHEASGQVCLGTAATVKQVRAALKLGGVCTALPAPSLIYPELLADTPQQSHLDCATAMQANAQSLMVNQAMAAVAAQYVYQLVVQRRLRTFVTEIDLLSLAMRSTSITAAALSRVTGLSVAALKGEADDETSDSGPSSG